jgi:hypothetical protein
MQRTETVTVAGGVRVLVPLLRNTQENEDQ